MQSLFVKKLIIERPSESLNSEQNQLEIKDIEDYENINVSAFDICKNDADFIVERMMENIDNAEIVKDGIEELVGLLKTNHIMPKEGKLNVHKVFSFNQLKTIVFTHKKNSQVMDNLRRHFYGVF